MAISGICISMISNNPIVSFIGYNMVVLPMGIVLSLVLQGYNTSVIAQTFIQATFITLLMIIIATIEPEIFKYMGHTLMICLVGVIAIELIMVIFGMNMPRWWHWIVALLFCVYIGYDQSRAQRKRRTLNNAVDSAIDLYVDFINLF